MGEVFVRWSVPGAAHQLVAGESESESESGDVWGRIEPVLQSGDVFSDIKEDGGFERRRRRRRSLFSGGAERVLPSLSFVKQLLLLLMN